MTGRYLKLNEAAEFLSVEPHQLRRMARRGEIGCFQIGKRGLYRFSLPQLMEWQVGRKVRAGRSAVELEKLERIETMQAGDDSCEITDERQCADCMKCLDAMTLRQYKWARMASRKYGACVSLIAHWAGDWTCPLCGKDISNGGASLDHDHTTGQPRGVICARCNHGLHYVDRADWLQRALLYVQTTGARSARVSERPEDAVNGAQLPRTEL